jgi:hypothetical protein
LENNPQTNQQILPPPRPQKAISEGSSLSRLSEAHKIEAKEFVYRAYVALGQYNIVLGEVRALLLERPFGASLRSGNLALLARKLLSSLLLLFYFIFKKMGGGALLFFVFLVASAARAAALLCRSRTGPRCRPRCAR